MPLFAKSFQELMTDSISELAQNTNLTRLSPGGIARAILESVNRRLAQAYDVFDLNLARAFVSSAPGQFLELIGALLGVTRTSAIAASVTSDAEILKFYVDSGTFGDINNTQDIVIPQGRFISTEPNNGGIRYRTIEQVTLLASQSEVWFSAEAAVPGEDSNVGDRSLIYHNFTDYADSDNETLLVTNIHPVANGSNFESDANYRFRIVNRVLEAEAANLTAIRLAVLSTPGVADAIIVPRYRGIGTVGIILKATIPIVSTTLIENVRSNVQKVQALGDLVYIMKPKESGLAMKTTIYYSDRLPEENLTLIEDTIKEVITEFVNNLDIGEEFSVNRMVAQLFAIDDHISNIGIPGTPIEELYIYLESKLQDNKVRQTLLGDYTPSTYERVIIEPNIENPIILDRAYKRR